MSATEPQSTAHGTKRELPTDDELITTVLDARDVPATHRDKCATHVRVALSAIDEICTPITETCDTCGKRCSEADGWFVRTHERRHDEVYCTECFEKSPFHICGECDAWVDTDEAGSLKDVMIRGYESAVCATCYEKHAPSAVDQDSDSSSVVPPVCDKCGDQCDTDDGWHLRPRLHDHDEVYCDDCFQKSPYRVCFRCDKWVDIVYNNMHRVEEERRFEMMICDECENRRILAIAAAAVKK